MHPVISTIAVFLFIQGAVFAQKVNVFPQKSDPLHVKVDLFTKMMLGNLWNEGIIMHWVIYPPAGLDRPVIGGYADCLDETTNMLAAYAHKYQVTGDPRDKEMADRIFQTVLKFETVTGVPGLVSRGFYKTDTPLWHESELWYPLEWHWSTTMPGYRWLGDLSADKFTSLFYALGIYWEFCADEGNKSDVAGFLDRFLGRCIDHNFKLVDLDGKMTLWGNFCPDLPHQELNSLEMLMALKVTFTITGKERFNAAYHMLIDRYHYDDRQLHAKIVWPAEWQNSWDDVHAAKSLYMLMRYEHDPSLLIKYRMNLNIHWYDWQNHDFSFENDVFLILVYQILMDENVLNEIRIKGIKEMWGFERAERSYNIPQEDGTTKTVVSRQDRSCSGMIRNYWMGRYYGLIDPEW